MQFQSNEDVILYTLKNHSSYKFVTKEEFLNDFKIFKIIKRHIIKYGTAEHKLQLVSNYIITLNNIFGRDVVFSVLFYFLSDEYTSELTEILNHIDTFYFTK